MDEAPERVTLHCPGCQHALKVPRDSVGRAARCPICRTKFVIPDPKQLMEETVSNWLEEDLEGDEDEIQQSTETTGAPTPTERQESPRQLDTPEEPAAPSEEERPLTPKRAASQLTSGDTIYAESVYVPPKPEAKPEPAATGADAREAASGPAAQAAAPSPRPEAGTSKLPYPTSLHITEPIPHLVVRNVSQQGVCFQFDALWLQHDGFRLSMPVQCAFCGHFQRQDLTARPLVFPQKSYEQTRTPAEIEHGHTQSMRLRHSEGLLAAMGTLPGMRRGFEAPLPYYACAKHMGAALRCQVEDRIEGGATCEVTVPHGPTALRWLERVNGVCGREAGMLERELETLNSDAWQSLTEPCRQRLSVWCAFTAGEHFQHYFLDADLARADAGLAGVVVTDQRLIYHKYHQQGQVRLDDDATLLIQRDDRMATLFLELAGKRVKLATLHAKDVTSLIEALTHAPKLKVTLLKAGA